MRQHIHPHTDTAYRLNFAGAPAFLPIYTDTAMLKLSEILVAHHDIESFDELIPLIQAVARSGERFFRMDVKPPYPDTPENWEDRLEAAFSGLLR